MCTGKWFCIFPKHFLFYSTVWMLFKIVLLIFNDKYNINIYFLFLLAAWHRFGILDLSHSQSVTPWLTFCLLLFRSRGGAIVLKRIWFQYLCPHSPFSEPLQPAALPINMAVGWEQCHSLISIRFVKKKYRTLGGLDIVVDFWDHQIPCFKIFDILSYFNK